MMGDFEFKDGNTFLNTLKNRDLDNYQKSLSEYVKLFEELIKIPKGTVIFVDTNVLLRYYSISLAKRAVFIKFFNDHKNNIIVTNQVINEFVKNRDSVIDKFFRSTLDSIESHLEKNLLNRIQQTTQELNELLLDFKYLKDYLDDVSQKTTELQEQVNKDVTQLKNDFKGLKFEDEMLSLVGKFKRINNLKEDELKKIKEEFASVAKNITPEKIKSEIGKVEIAIPGFGDIKEKGIEGYGDYVLLHEMIKHLAQEKCNAVFLTMDTSKGDWLKSDGEPHIHYIRTIYQIAQQSLIIIDADKYLSELFKTSFDSFLKEDLNVLSDADTFGEYSLQLIPLFSKIQSKLQTIEDVLRLEVKTNRKSILVIRYLVENGFVPELFEEDYIRVRNVRNVLAHRSEESLDGLFGRGEIKFVLELAKQINQQLDVIIKLIK